MNFLSLIDQTPKQFFFQPEDSINVADLIAEPTVLLHTDHQASLKLLGEKLPSLCGVLACFDTDLTIKEYHKDLWLITIPITLKDSLHEITLPLVNSILSVKSVVEENNNLLVKLARADRRLKEFEQTSRKIADSLNSRIQDLITSKNLLDLSNTHITQIVNLIPQHVYVVNGKGVIVLCNNSFAASIDSQPKVLMGKLIDEVNLGNNWVSASKLADEQVIQTASRVDNFISSRCIDGMQRDFSIMKIPYNQAGNEEAAILTIATDITDQVAFEKSIVSVNSALEQRVEERTKALEAINQDLHEARIIAEAASKTKGLFLATMSHELRTPMNAVLGLLEILDDTNLDAQQKKSLSTISSSAKMLLNIVDDVLDLSKIEAGKLELEFRPVNIRNVATEVVDSLQSISNKKSVDLTLSVDDCLPELLLCDEFRFRQVLYNMCSNGIKFTEPKEKKRGSVEVHLEVEKIEPHVCDVTLKIIDTGIGIQKSSQDTLFLPFSQANVATARQFGGTGLGLSIVKELVKLMHGKIICDSIVGEGTTFTIPFTLDIVNADDKAIPKIMTELNDGSTLTLPLDIHTKKILVAEDNPVNRLLFKKQLDKLGIDAVIVDDGQAALHYCQDHSVDFIFTDCDMPIMNGYELSNAIRALETDKTKPRIPIVAVTANAIKGDDHRCYDAQMDDYLTKPVSVLKLRDMLIEHMPRV